MSPTIFLYKGYRFFFFSREERRMHVHVSSSEGEAKFWLEPDVSLAHNYRLSRKELKRMEGIVKKRRNEITGAWKKHFEN